MKGKRKLGNKEYSSITEQRLAGIEASLKEIENYIHQTKSQMTQLDRVAQEVEEIKKKSKARRKRFSLFTRTKKEQPSQSNTMAPLLGLLQNPAIQGMLAQNKLNGGKSAGLAGLDVTQMLALLQSPMLQSLMKTQKNDSTKKIPGKAPASKKQSKTGGFNLSQAMSLLQDPAIQALFKNTK